MKLVDVELDWVVVLILVGTELDWEEDCVELLILVGVELD